MAVKRLMIETKQSILKILEVERQYREALKTIAEMDKITELLRDADDKN